MSAGHVRKKVRLKLVVVLTSLLLTACLLSCGGFVSWRILILKDFSSDVFEGQPEAVAFQNDIFAGRLERAYARTSTTYRTKVSYDEFCELLKQYPSLKHPSNAEVVVSTTAQFPNDQRLLVTLRTPGGSFVMCLALVKEAAGWKIGGFATPAEDGGLQKATEKLLAQGP